jgi:hypothetical protein
MPKVPSPALFCTAPLHTCQVHIAIRAQSQKSYAGTITLFTFGSFNTSNLNFFLTTKFATCCCRCAEAEHRSTFYIPYWNVPLLRAIVPRQRAFAADIKVINECLDGLILQARAASVQLDEETLQNRDYSKVCSVMLWFIVGLGHAVRMIILQARAASVQLDEETLQNRDYSKVRFGIFLLMVVL